MHDSSTDEQTSLLTPTPRSSPIPWSQFSITLWIQFIEPLSTQVISPFAPQVSQEFTWITRAWANLLWMVFQLVRDIGVTHGNDAQVGYYVGILVGIKRTTKMLESLNCLRWTAFRLLHGTSYNSTLLEPNLWSSWPQTCTPDRFIQRVFIHALLWVLQNFLGPCPEVYTYLLYISINEPGWMLPIVALFTVL